VHEQRRPLITGACPFGVALAMTTEVALMITAGLFDCGLRQASGGANNVGIFAE